ncbi:MAG: HNH endonuclease signature motif containing protein [Acidimicrobiia bacterium]
MRDRRCRADPRLGRPPPQRRRLPQGDRHQGVDVLAVAHLGRTIPAHLRTAVEERDQECVVEGCHVNRHLEIDHNIPVADRGPTASWNLNRLCPWHHDHKTRHNLRLEGEGEGEGSRKRLVPAGRPPPDAVPRPRAREPALV